jgi:hypothetical protein
MPTMKTLVAFALLAAPMLGQPMTSMPELGINLIGTAQDPVIDNHSGRSITGSYIIIDGAPATGGFPLAHPITDSAPPVSHMPPVMPAGSGAATLKTVIFADGECVGIEPSAVEWQFKIYRKVGAQLKAVKNASSAARAAIWNELKAETALSSTGPLNGRDSTKLLRRAAAVLLVAERNTNGDAAAFEMAEHFASLPEPWKK